VCEGPPRLSSLSFAHLPAPLTIAVTGEATVADASLPLEINITTDEEKGTLMLRDSGEKRIGERGPAGARSTFVRGRLLGGSGGVRESWSMMAQSWVPASIDPAFLRGEASRPLYTLLPPCLPQQAWG